ncbi:hypothetical protein BSY18_3913 (plasmid) [Blastomonas sp. RAC04]|nr:hypothetical protein BSY18_3913 [Blastomonas sp. RAC04]
MLPLEATYVVNGGAPIAFVVDRSSGCSNCTDNESQWCHSYFLALFQRLPESRVLSMDIRDLLSLPYLPFPTKFPPLSDGRPAPPPPQRLR